MNFDDNAEFRQKKIFEMEDDSESDPTEVEASKSGLSYISMDGNIACLGLCLHLLILLIIFIKIFFQLSKWGWTGHGDHGHDSTSRWQACQLP